MQITAGRARLAEIMRIISGTSRGRRLSGPRGAAIRPTADQVKEALFNILVDRIVGARFLKHVRGPAYDIVFLDPPYQTQDAQRVLPSVGGDAIIQPHGVVVVEHFHKTHLDDRIGHLALVKTYRYGDTCLSVYQRERAEASA